MVSVTSPRDRTGRPRHFARCRVLTPTTGWWLAKVGEQQAWVPAAYVEEQAPAPPPMAAPRAPPPPPGGANGRAGGRPAAPPRPGRAGGAAAAAQPRDSGMSLNGSTPSLTNSLADALLARKNAMQKGRADDDDW